MQRQVWIRSLAAAAVVAGLFADSRSPVPEFIPDSTFSGSRLAGWRPLGDADWIANDGMITGTARPGSRGGWLITDKKWQDVIFYAQFRCSLPCDAGILTRMEQTDGNRIKGVYVSLSDTDLSSYRVTLDARGLELSRERLGPGGGFNRTVVSGSATPAGRGSSAGRGAPGGNSLPVHLPELDPPVPGIHPNAWNEIQFVIDSNILRPFLNRGNEIPTGDTGDEGMGYGPIALHVAGGSVQMKTISFKDLNSRVILPEQVSSRFRKQQLDEFYYGWGIATEDFNRDGVADVVSGPSVYYGPDYTRRSEVYVSPTHNPGSEFAPNMVILAHDFNGDGWPDILNTESRPMFLYLNPAGENRRWNKSAAIPGITSEIVTMRDLDGDGRPEVIFATGGGGANGQIAYATYDPAHVTQPWQFHFVSERGLAYVHSIGVGDINGDGRPDILQTAGWWEQPASNPGGQLWKYHPQAFGRWGRSEGAGGGEIQVYDVNGDGRNDVVTSLNAHGFGLAWFEQKRDSAGNIDFVRHMIIDDFSTDNVGGVTITEMHASGIGDIDGDGIPDLIIGKRHWAHLQSFRDADPDSPAWLYAFRTVRNPRAPGGAEFVPEMIHNQSGVGSNMVVRDLNGDGLADIATATNRGTFIFWNTTKATRAGRGSKR